MLEWSGRDIYVFVGGGLDFDCGQVGLEVTLVMTVALPVPQIVSVTGCMDVGTGTFNCTRDDSLTVHGSGFTTFAVQLYGAALLPDIIKSLPSGLIVNDSTIAVPAGWYNCTTPAPYATVTFGVLFNPTQRRTIYGNGLCRSACCRAMALCTAVNPTTAAHPPPPLCPLAPPPRPRIYQWVRVVAVTIATVLALLTLLATLLYCTRVYRGKSVHHEPVWHLRHIEPEYEVCRDAVSRRRAHP